MGRALSEEMALHFRMAFPCFVPPFCRGAVWHVIQTESPAPNAGFGEQSKSMSRDLDKRFKIKRAEKLLKSQHLPESRQIFAQLAVLDPQNPDYWWSIAMIDKALGRRSESIEALRKVVRHAPGHGVAWNELGLAYCLAADFSAAISAFHEALPYASDRSRIHLNISTCHARLHQLAEASEEIKKALHCNPVLAEAHVQYCEMLQRLNRHEDVLAAVETALRHVPDDPDVRVYKVRALAQLGRTEQALKECFAGLLSRPDTPVLRAALFELCDALATPRAPDPTYEDIIRVACTWEAGNTQALGGFICRYFVNSVEFMQTLGTLFSDPARLQEDVAAAALLVGNARPFFSDFLGKVINVDGDLERVLSSLRRRLLMVLADNVIASYVPEDFLVFVSSLATQCFHNEYVWHEDAVECKCAEHIACSLNEELVGTTHALSLRLSYRLAALALYRPLIRVLKPEVTTWIAQWQDWGVLSSLMRMQIVEPLRERDIQSSMPRLSQIEDPTSLIVRAQYEENPYPRWLSSPGTNFDDFLSGLKGLFGDQGAPGYLDRPMDVLVAGCGTGKHAIQAALCYPASRVAAIDFSLSSLAYAKRKAQDFNLNNVEFYQADVLRLNGLDRQFQIIESIGVLHHLHEPVKGWRVLVGLLSEAGLMYVALYSAIARAALLPGKRSILSDGLGSDANGIRRFRKKVLETWDPELYEMSRLSEDFYSLSGCRDLFFHAQERLYTLPQLASIIRELNLVFLGFDLPPEKMAAYRAFNPNDPRGLDLAAWHRFEMVNRRLFSGMYRMWLQKAV